MLDKRFSSLTLLKPTHALIGHFRLAARYVIEETKAQRCCSVMAVIVVSCTRGACDSLMSKFGYIPGFHMFCLVPPLTSIPRGQWFCHTCLFGTGGDFGFDEGEEHSLSSFQARDEAFRKMWFTSHPPPQPKAPLGKEEEEDLTVNVLGNVRVTEQDVEKEFWRLVQSPSETVEIEYGADVHSTTHGR